MTSLKIISASERIKETKGIKICLFGKSGIGKTSQLLTLPEESTLFFDLEAGDLSVRGWKGDAIRPRTWPECREATAIMCDELSHHDASVMSKYNTIFIDSGTAITRTCFHWCKSQYSERSIKCDMRPVYGLYNQEISLWASHLEKVRHKNLVLVGILDEKRNDNGELVPSVQMEGSKIAPEIIGIVDIAVTMIDVRDEQNQPCRAFICNADNEWRYPAKDRSGRLAPIEEANLGKVMQKALGLNFTTAGDADSVANLSTNNEVLHGLEQISY